jgi:hypothetical protein
MITIYEKDGVTKVCSSQTLRGVLVHNRTSGLPTVTIIEQKDGGAECDLVWNSGDVCTTNFASYSIAKQWFAKRSKNIFDFPLTK